ncbi:MAG: signal peptide peptidase SppA [Leptospiraceae bacterium]|nr:signal peptide peptidase SppA [Leptospiraceae bacterium]
MKTLQFLYYWVFHIFVKGEVLLVEVPSKFSSVQKSTILKIISGKDDEEFLIDFLTYLRLISKNPYIKKVFFMVKPIKYGLAEVDSICREIENLNSSGKETIAFTESGDLKTLYLLTYFQKKYTMDTGEFLSILPSSESFFFGKTAKKLGVEVESYASGAYKSFGEIFSKDKYSKPAKENIENLVNSIKDIIVQRFLESTNLKEKDLQKPILSSQFLLEKNFFDGFLDEEDFEENYSLKDFPKNTDSKNSLKESSEFQVLFFKKKKDFELFPKRKKSILILPLKGNIQEGDVDEEELKADSIHAKPLIKILRKIKNNKKIAGVILEMDTGGGSAFASEIIHKELEKLKKEKKLYCYFQNISASGGYYISTACEKIYSSKFCITGSIGTIVLRPNLKGLYDKLGITKDRIGFYENREIFSEYGKLSPSSKELIQLEIQRINSQFYKRVCDSRKITEKELEKLANGRVFSGKDFFHYKMVDSNSSIIDSIQDMKNELNLKNVNILYEPASYSLKSFFKDTKFIGSKLQDLQNLDIHFFEERLQKNLISQIAIQLQKNL